MAPHQDYRVRKEGGGGRLPESAQLVHLPISGDEENPY